MQIEHTHMHTLAHTHANRAHTRAKGAHTHESSKSSYSLLPTAASPFSVAHAHHTCKARLARDPGAFMTAHHGFFGRGRYPWDRWSHAWHEWRIGSCPRRAARGTFRKPPGAPGGHFDWTRRPELKLRNSSRTGRWNGIFFIKSSYVSSVTHRPPIHPSTHAFCNQPLTLLSVRVMIDEGMNV